MLEKISGAIISKTTPIVNRFSANKPEIFLVGGIAAIVAGTVFACRATLRVEAHAAKKDEALDDIVIPVETEYGSYTVTPSTVEESVVRKEKAKAYLKMWGEIGKDYAPAVILMGSGIAMVIGSHHILRTRMAALSAAYITLEQAYNGYRERVIADYGEEQDRKYRLGIYDESIEIEGTDKDGTARVATVVNEVIHADGKPYSPYARYFDAYNTNQFVSDQEANYIFLKLMQNAANEKLQRKGYLFLNEVYEMLGMSEVPEGQLVGWLLSGDGDGYVDFGLYEARNAGAREAITYNDFSTIFVLDFNVDGIIWDRI